MKATKCRKERKDRDRGDWKRGTSCYGPQNL